MITIAAPPWAEVSPSDGEFKGAFFDILKAVTQRTSYQFTTTLTPFARAGREIERGSQDCTILAPLDELKVVRGEAVLQHPIGVIAHRRFALKTVQDLRLLDVSVLRGGGSMLADVSADYQINISHDTNYTMGLKKLARGRVDAVAGAIPTLQYIARLEGIAPLLSKPLVLRHIPLVFQCSRLSNRLNAMAAINKALSDMRRGGFFDTLKAKYQ
jgi:polar amino acid transport system substrate-binding protein